MSKKDTKKFRTTKEDVNVTDMYEITEIRPIDDDDAEVRTVNIKSQYATKWARIGTFLTSYCRAKFSRTIEPLLKDIVRVNTDSFLLTRKLTEKESKQYNITLSSKMGFFKLEKSGQCVVENCNSVKFT
jgi:hypothetical protein